MKKQTFFFLSFFIVSIAVAAQAKPHPRSLLQLSDIHPAPHKGAGGGVYYPVPASHQLPLVNPEGEYQQKVHGIITDYLGRPLTGATIILPTREQVLSDDKGGFSIAANDKSFIVDFFYVGHHPLKPDAMIRLYMEFKKYKGETKLPEQKLTNTQRKKFTLVEWGGAEIGSERIK